jgi:hypothetical protein
MPTALTAYLAGVTSVAVALTVGFGGALVISNAVRGDKPPPPSRIERVSKGEAPESQPAVSRTAFPEHASPVLVVPLPTTEATQDAASPNRASKVKRQTAASEPSETGPRTVSSGEDGKNTSKATAFEKRHDRDRRTNQNRKIAAKPRHNQRTASVPTPVPSREVVFQDPGETDYEDDFQGKASSGGRLSFFEE